MIQIKTASWFAELPPEHAQIGVSRYAPRYIPGGYRLFRALAPGDWFKTATLAEYATRYDAILATLDPRAIVDKLAELSNYKTAVLCCFERPREIHAGRQFCHRHIVAQWLENRLGLTIPEVDAPPNFDRFAHWRVMRVPAPSYKPQAPEDKWQPS